MGVRGGMISISFRSLLEDIASTLGFPRPVYKISYPNVNHGSGLVPKNVPTLMYFFYGADIGDLEALLEDAGEQAVKEIVDRFNVRIIDVNWPKRTAAEHQKRLFAVQRKWFSHFEKKKDNVIPHHQEWRGVDTSLCVVNLDFVKALDIIVGKLKIKVSPLDCMQLDGCDFLCFIAIYCVGDTYGVKWVAGDVCRTTEGAKQDVAKKPIDLLRKLFGFEVKDVNYAFLPSLRLECHLLEESCLAARDCAVVFEEPMEADLHIQEREILCVHDLNYMLPYL